MWRAIFTYFREQCEGVLEGCGLCEGARSRDQVWSVGFGHEMGDLTPKVAMIVSDKEVMDNIAASRPENALKAYSSGPIVRHLC